jgi:hypothetical protein
MATTTEKTLDYYIIILDESGSMFDHAGDTIGSLKQFHKSQQEISHPDSKFIVNTFNNKMKQRFAGTIGTELGFDYRPEGTTALFDAVGESITDTLNYLAKAEQKPCDVYVIILTDGEENSSRNYTGNIIKQMIETQKSADWKFIFMGANQDAMFNGNRIGIDNGSCLTYTQNSHATPNAFRCVSDGIKRQKKYYSATKESCQVAFTENERDDASAT